MTSTVVTSVSWDAMFDGKALPENLTRTTWREAVAAMAAKARQTLPESHGRVDSAVRLVLNGDVELLPDGKARVASQSHGTTVYHVVDGECACKDFAKAPSSWCKHRIAAGIAKRAYSLAKQRLAQLDGVSNNANQTATGQLQEQSQGEPITATVEVPTYVEPAVSTLPEAPASANVHVTLAGRQVQVTLRDSDEQRLLQRLEALLQRFPVVEASQHAPTEGWCSTHQVRMKRYAKGDRTWWSHKTADGQWCRGA